VYLEGTWRTHAAAGALRRQLGISALVGLGSCCIHKYLGSFRRSETNPSVIAGLSSRHHGCLRHKRLQSISSNLKSTNLVVC
jgi:hypothetical protein